MSRTYTDCKYEDHKGVNLLSKGSYVYVADCEHVMNAQQVQ